MRYDRALFRGGTGSGWRPPVKPIPFYARVISKCGNCQRLIQPGTVIRKNANGVYVHARCPKKPVKR